MLESPNLLTLNEKILLTRRQYGDREILEKDMPADPFVQFTSWFAEALSTINLDPSAMVLSTLDKNGYPDSRVVLLLGLKAGKFIFYTSYNGVKASQIRQNNKGAINFYWSPLSRQVRIKGVIEKISPAESKLYFSTRDRGGQLATHGAEQSSKIPDRDTLTQLYKDAERKFANHDEIPCPDSWGGYQFSPVEYEFFQGRDSRLHDRIIYVLKNNTWERHRVAP